MLPRAVLGQAIPDGTTPTPDPGPCIPLCTVTGGIADSTGSNLFHSFEQFSVPDGGTVVFDHPIDIENIITRVTGGAESTINGTLRTNLASEANLFLLNPGGILFGPNGSLDVGGSFVATTANAIQFGDQGTFSANALTSDPALLTVAPSAFLFTQAAPQPIVSQSSAFKFDGTTLSFGLSVPENKSLLFVGGNVIVERSPNALAGRSSVTVPGGRVELGGLGEPGRVTVTIDDDNLSVTYPNSTILADVLLDESQIDVFNRFSNAGTVVITANNLTMQNSTINSTTFGLENAGAVLIRANDSVTLTGSTIASLTTAAGEGGILNITAGQLSLVSSTLSVATNVAEGNAGNIALTAATISLSEDSNISSNSFGSESQPGGDAGEIVIQTDMLSLADSRITSRTIGESLAVATSGNLMITANALVSLEDESKIASETLGQRNAGDIRIDTPLLALDNSTISAEVDEENNPLSEATGQGGTIALDLARLSLNNGAQVTSSTSGAGKAGTILLQGSTVTVNFQEGTEILAVTSGPAEGGRIDVIGANDVTLTGDGSLSSSSIGSGPAGNVSIQSGGLFRAQDGARVKVSGESTGNSGILDVISAVAILDGGQLLASTQAGEDGNINLKIDDALILRGDSLISAAAFNNANGGNVDISSPVIIALFSDGPNGNDIQASAQAGNGGLITIDTNALFNLTENIAIDGNQSNDLDASSGTGINGEVVINNLELDPSPDTNTLPNGPGTPSITRGCQASGGGTSQFINSGRRGIAPSPYDPLSGDGIPDDIYPPGQPFAQHADETPFDTSHAIASAPSSATITEAQGWRKNTQGGIELVAEPAYQSICQSASAPGVS